MELGGMLQFFWTRCCWSVGPDIFGPHWDFSRYHVDNSRRFNWDSRHDNHFKVKEHSFSLQTCLEIQF